MATRRDRDKTVYHDVPIIPGHSELADRTLPNQHPIGAITGLSETLDMLKERSKTFGGKVDALDINGRIYDPDDNKVVHFEIPITGAGTGLAVAGRTVSIDPEVAGEIADLGRRMTAQETAGYATETYVTDADSALAGQLRSEISAVDNSAVHKTGTEYISGKKTFLGHTLVPAPSTGDEAVNRDYLDSRIGGEYPYTELTTTDWSEYFEGDGRAKYGCYFMLGGEKRFYLRGQAPDPKDFHVLAEGGFPTGSAYSDDASYSYDMYPSSFLNNTHGAMYLHSGTQYFQSSSAGVSAGIVWVKRHGEEAKVFKSPSGGTTQTSFRWYKKSYGTIPSGGLTLRFFLAAPDDVLPPAPEPDPNIFKYTDYATYSVVTGFASTSSRTPSIEIPAEHNGLPVTEIGADAFKGISILSQVRIPGSVTTINSSAFQNCTSLTTVNFLEDGLVTIGASAFSGCTRLETIHLPDSLVTLGNYVFNSTAVKVLELGPNIQTISAATIRAMQIVDVDPDNPYYVSEDNVIYTPDETSIIAYACKSLLNTLTVKATVRTIGDRAFDGAAALTSIALPSGLTTIGSYVFQSCTGLASVSIPDTVASIGSYAFQGCTALTTVRWSSALTEIPAYAFKGCTALTTVTGCSGATAIGNYAFSGCTALASAPIGSPLETIGTYAFETCTALTAVSFPASLETIGTYAFKGCTRLASLSLGSIATLPANAFNGCTGLTSLAFPNTLTAIDATTFAGCTGVITCAVGTGLASGLPLPSACGLLTAYTVASGNAVYSDDDGVLYEGAKLVQMPQSWPGSSYTVRAGTDEIAANAFQNCSGLNSLTLPSGLTAIPAYMCEGCTGLTAIEIPSGVASVGSRAFETCRALASVTVPASLTSIGSYAFHTCTALASVDISGVSDLGQYAFQGCTALASVTISAAQVPRYAFDGCSGLRTVTLADAVAAIRSYAFNGCTGTTSVAIGTGLATLDASWSPWKFYYNGSAVSTAAGLKGYTWAGASYLNLERQ